MKTKRHVIDLKERIDFGKIELKVGDIWEINENMEVITGFNYTEPEVISRINTLRRNKKVIIELGYSIDSNGKLKEFFAGIHHGEKVPPYIVSEQYSGLNNLLRKAGL